MQASNLAGGSALLMSGCGDAHFFGIEVNSRAVAVGELDASILECLQ
jgi:hypothetical protein